MTPDLMFYAVRLRNIRINEIYFHTKFTALALVHIAIGYR